MIFESVLSWFFGFVWWVVDLLPVTVIFGTLLPSPEPLIDVLNGVSCIMPVGSLVGALGVWIVLANFDLLSSVINWVIRKIPGVE